MASRQVCRVLAAVLTVGTASLTCVAAPARAGSAALPRGAPTAAAVTTPSLAVSVSSIGPALLTPVTPLVVKGTVRNGGATAVQSPVVRIVRGTEPLTQRSDVTAWAADRTPATGQTLISARVAATLAPGATASFAIRVKGLASLNPPAYGVLPLSVQTDSAAVHTFAAYQRKKEYEPLAISWIVPITLDPDPAMFGPAGSARDRAWSAAVGPGSRLDNLLTATAGTPATWAIDPLLTRQPALPGSVSPSTTTTSSPTSGPPPVPTVGGSASATEARLRSELSQRIRDLAPRHSPLLLPDSDADIASAAQAGAARRLVTDQVRLATEAASTLAGRADVAWPVDGAHTSARERALRQMYAGGLGAEIVSQLALPPSGVTDAARRSSGGLPLLAYDERLSAMLAATGSVSSAALSAQQFIADSVVLLNELPGTQRHVLVAAPRAVNPDPDGLRAFLAAVSSIPWLQPTGLDALIAAAARATPMAPAGTLVKRVPGSSADPVASGPAVLTPARGRMVEETHRTLVGVAKVRADGEEFARIWTEAVDQLTSARWRGHLRPWAQVRSRADLVAQTSARGITVSPRNVNFLADKGRLQITVANTLGVPVHDVTLRLTPDNPRLRVDLQPAVMHIGARSRTTVTARVTSLSAGLVPITTTLTGPDGTMLGRGTVLQVQLSPTGDWVYWLLGGIAVVILILGVARSARRRPRRAAALAAVPAAPRPKARR